jgi:outer membrane protein OmpA-like peptidoglycan-associated protein
LAGVIAAHPGLNASVEGYWDDRDANGDADSQIHAGAVRDALVHAGLNPKAVEASGMGGSRPLVANNTPAGRKMNRRVEIVVSGSAIGTLANWDHTYSLVSRGR